MTIKIIAIILGVFALFLTFKNKYILEKVFKVSELSDSTLLKVKYAALAIAVAAFLLVFLYD